MRRVLLVLAALAASGSLLFGSIVSCPTAGIPLPQLLASGLLEGGCIADDKLFSNFSYTGTVAASDITVNIGDAHLLNGTDQYSISVQAGSGGWVDPFDFAYTIAIVIFDTPATRIIQANSDVTAPGAGNASVLRTELIDDSMVLHTLVATQLGGASLPGLYTVSLAVDVDGTPATGTINSFTHTYFQGVPEPVTMTLVGGGLLLLGSLRRRLR